MNEPVPSPPPPASTRDPGARLRWAGAALLALALLVVAALLVDRARDPTLPLGVHGFTLWQASIPAWVGAGVVLALVGEPAGGARLRLGRAVFVVFALLSPPASGLVCGALRWYQTARLSAAFREEAEAVPAAVAGVRWETRTIEQERPRRSVELRTPYLVIAYRFDGPRELELKTDPETAASYEAALRARSGVERGSVPYPEMAWVLPDAPDRAVLAAADARPGYPVSGVVATLVCAALVTALTVGFLRHAR